MQPRSPIAEPEVEITHSVRLEHIQEVMSQSKWRNFNLPRDSRRMRETLWSPRALFKLDMHVRKGLVLRHGAWEFDLAYNFYAPRPAEEGYYDQEEAELPRVAPFVPLDKD